MPSPVLHLDSGTTYQHIWLTSDDLSSVDRFKHDMKTHLYTLLHSTDIIWLPATAISLVSFNWLIWPYQLCNRGNNLYNKRRYVCLFVCLFVMIYVPYSRPNGWADRDETWHTHSCPPRECFWQGKCQGHSRMPAKVTEVRNTRKATPSERLRNAVELQFH